MRKKSKKYPPSATFHLTLSVNDFFSRFAEKVSEEIFAKYDSDFKLGEKYATHITLYLFSAPLKNIDKLIHVAEKIAELIKPKEMKLGKLILSHDGWLMVDLKTSGELHEYHKRTVEYFNPLREGLLRKKYRYGSHFASLKDFEKKSLRNYGDKHAMQLFHPHISIAHFDNITQAQKVYKKYRDSFVDKSIKITKMELVKVIGDESGGVGKILFKHQFTKN